MNKATTIISAWVSGYIMALSMVSAFQGNMTQALMFAIVGLINLAISIVLK